MGRDSFFREKYTYGSKPTVVQLEDTLDVLKAERFARWQSMMSEEEKAEIEQAHTVCICVVRDLLDALTS